MVLQFSCVYTKSPLSLLSCGSVCLYFTWKRETFCPFIIILSIALFRRVDRSPRRTARKRRKLKIPSPLPWQWLLFTLVLDCTGRKYLFFASLIAVSSNSLIQSRSSVGRRDSNGILGSEELSNINIVTAVSSLSDLNCFTHGLQETGPTVPPDGDNSYNLGCTWIHSLSIPAASHNSSAENSPNILALFHNTA